MKPLTIAGLALAGLGLTYLVLRKPYEAKVLPPPPIVSPLPQPPAVPVPVVPPLPQPPAPVVSRPPSLAEKNAIRIGDVVTVNLALTTPDFDTPPSEAVMGRLGNMAMAQTPVRVVVSQVHAFPKEPPESRTSWDGRMVDPPNVKLSFGQVGVLKIEKKV